jgi:hypothetical protein
MKRKGDQIIEGAVEARAGYLDHRVLLVLVSSSVLAVAFLARWCNQIVRSSMAEIKEHMEVIGADGVHVGLSIGSRAAGSS